MIRCHMCGEPNEVEDTMVLSLMELFTYYDSVLCNTCFKQLIELADARKIKIDFNLYEYGDQDEVVTKFFWSTYKQVKDFFLSRMEKDDIPDEIECPECEGIMIWSVEELGENDSGEMEYGEIIYMCLNCGKVIYENNFAF